MIASLQGKIILKKEKFIILEVSGVGFEVFLAEPALNKIAQIGQSFNVFCYLDVGERSLKLFGFLTYEELELFRLLRNISGVGPRAALDISSIGSPEKIKKEIAKGNERIFEDIPGIGKKKASKIILELSGKLKSPAPSPEKETPPKDEALKDEAFLALLNLGFKKEEVKIALSQLPKEIEKTEEKIKEGLKILGK